MRISDWSSDVCSSDLISETILLLLGAALLVSAIERISGQLLAMDWPEVVYHGIGDALWDSSAVLDDGHGLGGFLADFTGYRASPSAMTLLVRSEEHTSELQSLMRISYAVFCLKT